MTFKKKLENFWFYYKYHTIIGTFMLIVLIISLVQCANRVEDDFRIVYVDKKMVATEMLEQKVAESVGDVNKDGKVSIYCDNIIIPENPETESDILMIQKLAITFVDGQSRIYIMEKKYFEIPDYAEIFEDLTLILPQEKIEGAIEYNGKAIAIPVGNFPYLKEAGIEGENIYVGVCRVTPANSSVKNIDLLYKTSIELIKKMAS